MKALASSLLGVIIGAVLALALALALAVVSHFVLTPRRLASVVDAAISGKAFDYYSTRADYFTECSLLIMEDMHPTGVAMDAVDTLFVVDPRFHPCDQLHHLTIGGAPDADLSNVFSYVNYPFGSRYLMGIALSEMGIRTARNLYEALSYASVSIWFLAMLARDRRRALELAALPMGLVLFFSFPEFGGNLGHAPGYFSGFLLLAIFVSATPVFSPWSMRLSFVAFFAVDLAFFDIMDGALPVMLGLILVVNRFFYASREESWLHTVGEALAIVAVIVGVYASYTVLRLAVLDYGFGIPWRSYLGELALRMGDSAGSQQVTAADVVAALWNHRAWLAWGGTRWPTAFLWISATAWIAAGGTVLVRRRLSHCMLGDLTVVIAAAFGILAWYALFPNHTFVHAWLMVRMVALPASLGFVALVLVVSSVTVGTVQRLGGSCHSGKLQFWICERLKSVAEP